MKTISGSSGRSLLLLITNILLMALGAITVASGSMAIGIFLLHLFTFASQLFLVVPVLLIMSGTLTIIVAIFGLSLFKRKNEKSGVFLAYASIILVALLISLSASISSFVLREAIAHRFSKTDVTSQLKGYATDPFLRSRWDSIQREFRCCGGYNVGSGYQDWEGVSVEPLPIGASPAALITGGSSDRGFVASLSQVPDSCCIRERIGCGKTAFEDDNSGTISQKIYVNGCMTEARTALFKHVMPLLLICALVSLVVGLIELLLLLCAVCFADHIKRLSSLDGSSTIGRSSSLSQEKQGIIQDTGEAYLSHEEKQLEYGLDNANPGYFNGEELIGNEDDSASWYDSSTNETRIRHQLPLLDGSPSLRKKFFFQGSQASLNNGYELQQNNQDPEAGTGTDSLAKPELEAKKSSEKVRKSEPQGLFGIFSVLSRLFGPRSLPTNRQQKELNLREDALDREATLMNVLKSVNNKSEPDIVEATMEKKSSGFFNFGKKSKSKENVLDSQKENEENTEVKKLPTLDDKTIDKNKKFPNMENLTETESKKSGWTRFKELRDTVFKRKHQTLKEEEPKEMTETETKTEGENENKDGDDAEGAGGETKDGDIDFEEKKKDKDGSETSESSTEASTSSTESDKSEDKKVERKSSSNSRKGEDSGTKVERKPSNRSVNFEEDELRKPELPAKPQFKSGTPIRGSTFQRSTSEAVIDEPALRSISPNRPLRVSGFGVTPQTNPRHTRTLSMTTNPKLNTIHEPVRRDVRVRTRSLQVAGNIPIDGAYDPDDEVAQYNRSLQQYGTVERRRYTTTSPGPYNRSLSPQSYLTQQQPQNRLARMQSLARSEEQLNKAPVMVEYLRPVGILTGNQSPPPRPGSAQAHRSRDNSQESVGHVTRINIEEKEDTRERSDSRTRRKSSRDKEDSRSRERSDSRKKSSKSKDHDKKKKKKKRSRSRKRSRSKSASSGSSSGSSGSESGSDSESDSESGSESDSKDRKRKSKRDRKSRKSEDRKSSRKESKSKHRKKSRRHRDDSSPEKKHRSKSSKSADKSDKRDRDRDRDRKSSSKRNEEVVTATMETSTSPTREQQRTVQQSYDTQDYMQRLPYENQSYVVDDPRNYYSTSTLPSNASLRKPSGILVPLQQPHTHTRAPSEPRVLSKKMSSNTLDRYTLMAANAQRSKSADRLPMKYRRVSLDPGYHQGYPQQQGQKLRSVSMATHEAGDLHVLANPAQTYRTTVEMEPHSGEIYTVQQGPGGVRMAKSSRVRVSQQEDMMGHRRPTHISEARLMVQGDGSEQITLPHGMMPPTF